MPTLLCAVLSNQGSVALDPEGLSTVKVGLSRPGESNTITDKSQTPKAPKITCETVCVNYACAFI